MGRIQQIQSFSTLDGPGTRCVVFLQGCPVACLFCHNPDSWEMGSGEEISGDELLRRIDRYRPFLNTPGLTISGGEPLVQPDFTYELIRKAQDEGWHVAVDTSGWGRTENFVKVVNHVDLLILSIKHSLYPERISRCSGAEISANLLELQKIKIPVWLRYVVIPGWNDEPEALEALKMMVKNMPNLAKVEILPYNSLAETKWKKLGWDSPLFHDEVKVSEERLREVEDFLKLAE